jgi:hypothetical protein
LSPWIPTHIFHCLYPTKMMEYIVPSIVLPLHCLTHLSYRAFNKPKWLH